MDATSPTKRRVLASLDPNASPRPTRLDAKQLAHAPSSPLKRVTVFSASPSQPETSKRPLLFGELAGNLLHPAKKVCQEVVTQDMAVLETFRVPELHESDSCDQSHTAPERRQSASPELSSLFDSSVIDTSQATTVTEPDVVAVTLAASAAASTLGPIPRPATRPRLTREEAREKAEILKLRLGLASYKLRTGQTEIPLEQLEQQSAIKHSHIQSRNSASWASSRLRSQLQLQRAELAASAGLSNATSSHPGQAAGRRPLPAAPVRRTSSDEVSASASFSSQVQWSQGSSESQAAPTGDDATEEPTRQELDGGGARQASSWNQDQIQTPRRQFRVELEADEERLTSSALRGGAASGLLSLAQARS
ncbi:hypothetical protein BR93DRAFT_925204 [Coniochaeta sp. PMI_546]|nr:hypothetical protein BR93DRAFT_925204 [Coniochaeta sp. PMI_546]